MPTTVLVEGDSDALAIEALAARLGRDLRAEGITIAPMGGATNIGHFLTGAIEGVRLAGLCDAGEEHHFRRSLERAGIGRIRSRTGMEAVGFFVCDADLEDELIRSLGTEMVERVIDAQGELASLRIMQQQPAQRGRTLEQQLRRFMGTRSRRKAQYAHVLVEALDLDRVPRPLERLLAYL